MITEPNENMTDKTYNGWTNYETWNINLWIGNESGSHSYWTGRAQEALDRAESSKHFTRKEHATFVMADLLKEEYEELYHDFLKESKNTSSWVADLLGAALSEVNWHEIAASLLENCEAK